MCHAPRRTSRERQRHHAPLRHASTTSTAHGPVSATVVHGNALDLYPAWPAPTGDAWSRMRSKWTHTHGTTNVWREGTVRGPERLKASGTEALHTNQKPLALMDLNVLSVTDPGDVVWEPFGGLCTAAIAAARNGQRGFAAELTADVYEQASGRVADELG